MPILSRLTSKDVGPAILAWRAPKKRDLRFVLDCLRRGVTWVAARPKALASGDRRAIADMKDQLTAAWAAPADDTRLTAMRMFVREQIIDPGHLEVMAREVLACREMMARIKPYRILIDSMENPTASLPPSRKAWASRPISRFTGWRSGILRWIFLAATPPSAQSRGPASVLGPP